MIADLIRAIDAVAARCDVIADRLDHQNVVVNDAVTIFGEELTRLRAESAPGARGRRTAATIRLRPPMSEPGTERATLFLSRAWKQPGSELSFVTRALAGAVSRTSPVTVLVPVCGRSHRARWCLRSHRRRRGARRFVAGCPPTRSGPGRLPAETTIVVDEPDPAVLALLDLHAPGRLVHTIMPTDPGAPPRPLRPLRFTGSPGSDGTRLHRAARADQPAGGDTPAQRARLHRVPPRALRPGRAHPRCRPPRPWWRG